MQNLYKRTNTIYCWFKFSKKGLIHVHFASGLKNSVAYCVFLAKLGFI